MQFSTSFLSQTNFDTSMPCRKVPIEKGFQLPLEFSNLDVFPSFYPMNNNFHHQQTQVNPTLTWQNSSFSYLPSKKVKINDNSERMVQHNIHAQLSQGSSSKKSCEFTMSNIPSKVNFSKNQNGMELLKHKKMPNVEIKQRNQKEPLILEADHTLEDFNMFYEKKIESYQQELEIQKKLFLHQVIKGKIMEYAKLLRSIQSQGHRLVNPEKHTETRSAEDILKEEYIIRHIKQSVLPLLKLCKNNQADLAQYLKRPVLDGSQNQDHSSQLMFENFKIEAGTLFDEINIKQEGSC